MIQISEPGIEALVQQRLIAGRFESVEEVLRQALTDAPLPQSACSQPSPQTGAELVEALQRSPLANINIDLESYRGPMPIRLAEF